MSGLHFSARPGRAGDNKNYCNLLRGRYNTPHTPA